MNFRGLLLLGSVMASGALATIAACSGPDPGAISFAERPSTSTSSGSSPSSTSSSGNPGSSSGGLDGGVGEGGAVADLVFGTSTFAAPATPPTEANAAAAEHDGGVVGKDCTQAACHGTGGAGPTWAFAGTVQTATTGGSPVKGAEVRVTAAGTTFGSTYTDSAGNFYFEKVNGDIPAAAVVGVRTATKSVNMIASPAAGCNGAGTCHGTNPAKGTQGVITLAP